MQSMTPKTGLKRTDELRKDAVRIALTGGLTRKQVSELAHAGWFRGP